MNPSSFLSIFSDLWAQTKQISSVNRSFFECLYLSNFALLSFQWHRLFYLIAISTSEPVPNVDESSEAR